MIVIGPFAIKFILCKKNTVWWYNIATKPDIPRQRADKLFGLERIFIRAEYKYIYNLTIGRLQILIHKRS